MVCEAEIRPALLVRHLAAQTQLKTIVYCMTCACVDYWGTVLPRLPALRHLPILPLHGKMKQPAREAALARFTQLQAGVLLCTDVAARGLDIPGVDSIVQLDAPQDPKAFVHRVGRTARMGRQGASMLYLLPEEDAYCDFLRLQGVPLQEAPPLTPPMPTPLTEQLRGFAQGDRAVMEKGLRAVVSFVRAYKEHHCNFIFRWKELPLGRLAMGFGLLQLPAMPELKRKPSLGAGFVAVRDLDLEAICYKDKGRQKQRQQSIKEANAEGGPETGQAGKRGREEEKEGLAEEEAGAEVEEESSDGEEMAREYRLLKQEKKKRQRGGKEEVEEEEEASMAGVGEGEGRRRKVREGRKKLKYKVNGEGKKVARKPTKQARLRHNRAKAQRG